MYKNKQKIEKGGTL